MWISQPLLAFLRVNALFFYGSTRLGGLGRCGQIPMTRILEDLVSLGCRTELQGFPIRWCLEKIRKPHDH